MNRFCCDGIVVSNRAAAGPSRRYSDPSRGGRRSRSANGVVGAVELPFTPSAGPLQDRHLGRLGCSSPRIRCKVPVSPFGVQRSHDEPQSAETFTAAASFAIINFMNHGPIHPKAQQELSKSRGQVPFPPGYGPASRCPHCHSDRLVAVLINPTADEKDPDILCLNCGNKW
jgi:hypothetical protein